MNGAFKRIELMAPAIEGYKENVRAPVITHLASRRGGGSHVVGGAIGHIKSECIVFIHRFSPTVSWFDVLPHGQ